MSVSNVSPFQVLVDLKENEWIYTNKKEGKIFATTKFSKIGAWFGKELNMPTVQKVVDVAIAEFKTLVEKRNAIASRRKLDWIAVGLANIKNLAARYNAYNYRVEVEAFNKIYDNAAKDLAPLTEELESFDVQSALIKQSMLVLSGATKGVKISFKKPAKENNSSPKINHVKTGFKLLRSVVSNNENFTKKFGEEIFAKVASRRVPPEKDLSKEQLKIAPKPKPVPKDPELVKKEEEAANARFQVLLNAVEERRLRIDPEYAAEKKAQEEARKLKEAEAKEADELLESFSLVEMPAS